ncbi:MAG: hypothetical protein D6788_05390 [Planctomycetota bacterium]|nr:MAG: hypothetical protein D6788_05390 [Planctomycetota bacterium]
MYDITPAITTELDVWPGDTPPTREVLQDIERGDAVTLSTLRATVHLGAHADAPSHYGAGGASIEACPLERYLGPCRVVSVKVPRGARITPEMLPEAIDVARVLFRTNTFPDPTRWNEDFAALSAELIEALAERGVRLVGIDTPSVDLFDSQDLPAHKACLARDILVLEGLVLRDVPDGVYELIALPLPLAGFDASPVRAVLRPSR